MRYSDRSAVSENWKYVSTTTVPSSLFRVRSHSAWRLPRWLAGSWGTRCWCRSASGWVWGRRWTRGPGGPRRTSTSPPSAPYLGWRLIREGWLQLSVTVTRPGDTLKGAGGRHQGKAGGKENRKTRWLASSDEPNHHTPASPRCKTAQQEGHESLLPRARSPSHTATLRNENQAMMKARRAVHRFFLDLSKQA